MSDSFYVEIDQLVRARYSLLYIVTWEEDRVCRILSNLAEKQKKLLFDWTITDGLRQVNGTAEKRSPSKRTRQPLALLNDILQADTSAFYLLRDFHSCMDSQEITRQMRDLSRALRRTKKTIIIVAPVLKIPQDLEKSITIVDLPLPSYEELGKLLNDMTSAPHSERQFQVKLTDSDRDALVKAAQGLTLTEAENAFARAVVNDRVLDANDVEAIIAEKKQVIRKSEVLEYYDVVEKLDEVGGMDLLKDWLQKRVKAFSPEARKYRLPSPKGILLMGVQGCGKSLLAKAIASQWRLPMLRLDMSRIFQGYIGSSEQNMRKCVKVAEGIAPAILWIDEIEKAFSGLEGSSSTDAGTTSRVVGTFLTWMQEKTAPVFVVATANEVKGLPPELLRKGRLDEIFFVDLPRTRERTTIFKIHLRKVGRDPEKFDVRELALYSKGFSGAEIEQAIVEGLHNSFFANREVTTEDILLAIRETVPLSTTMREKIEKLRMWARGRARPVSSLQLRRKPADGK